MGYSPRTKNNICTNAHPVGCYFNVYQQVLEASENKINGLEGGTALVIGASSGIGLASRIALSFSYGMDTLGVYFDRAAQPHKYGNAAWYKNQALEYFARRADRIALSTNQDAFQRNAKDWVIQKLQQSGKKIDVLVYSLASPKRNIKGEGEYKSALKPVNSNLKGKSLDVFKGTIDLLDVPVASQQEINDTIKVMGGDDWQEWVARLKEAGVLANNFKTIAYSYEAPALNRAIYSEGTLGLAKEELKKVCENLDTALSDIQGQARIGMMQASLTPSSSVIPTLPLYMAVLHQQQLKKGLHESALQQVTRLFRDNLFSDVAEHTLQLRVDDIERNEEIQKQVSSIINQINGDNLKDLINLGDFKQYLLQQFGFSYDFIDYNQRPDPLTPPAIHDFSQMLGMKKAG
ncbi:trans-2-enoyl-CoA reductase family protein [Oceaniserpentilla sp. 4NH20-0058]|uniref:hypothetical protein n=1 Tax=Oceaniserpentilla sp. 4NH20-0058 TaxID=3127660 RepID=UPI00310B0134